MIKKKIIGFPFVKGIHLFSLPAQRISYLLYNVLRMKTCLDFRLIFCWIIWSVQKKECWFFSYWFICQLHQKWCYDIFFKFS